MKYESPQNDCVGGLLMHWLWERAACGSIKLFQSRKKKSTQLLTAPSLAHEENYGTVSAAYQVIYIIFVFFFFCNYDSKGCSEKTIK